MPSFTAENVDSAGEIFATEQVGGSSVHYPLSKLVWGTDSAIVNAADTSTPFPVRLHGNSTTNPVGVDQIGYVAPSTTVTVANPTDTTVTISAAIPQSSVTVASGTITVGNDTTDPVGVDQIGYVAPSTTVTVTNIAANDTVVTVTNPTDTTVTISAAVPQSSVTVANTDTARIGVASNATNDSVGALQTFATVLSSAIESVTSSAARLYGWHIFNPDTAGDVYVKIFDDDSTGVTKGTTAATQNLAVPFGGGNNVMLDQGALMSSGISLLAAGGTALTDTSAPSTSMVITLWYKDVSG